MTDVRIRLYYKLDNGQIEDGKQDLELSDFAGYLPLVGDKILDVSTIGQVARNVPENRQILTVISRVFNPCDHKDGVALICETRTATEDEIALLPQG